MEPFQPFFSPAVVLPVDDIDTDQIIPARFLTGTDRSGLGDALFADWRYDAEGGRVPDFVLNRPEAEGARILVAGANFGCGSSREHAPWALVEHGFRAIVSTSFADIFRNNALKNHLLPIAVDPGVHEEMMKVVEERPGARFHVDLARRVLRFPDGMEVHFEVDAFARHCILTGQDELGFLLDGEAAIGRFEEAALQDVSTLLTASPSIETGPRVAPALEPDRGGRR